LRGVEKEFPFRVGDGEDVASAADDDVGVETEGPAMRGFLEEEELLFLDRDFHAVGSMPAQGAGDRIVWWKQMRRFSACLGSEETAG
jgi:hypothetical protein